MLQIIVVTDAILDRVRKYIQICAEQQQILSAAEIPIIITTIREDCGGGVFGAATLRPLLRAAGRSAATEIRHTPCAVSLC